MFKNIKFLASLTSVTSAGGILAYASLTEDEKKKFASACNVSPFLSQTVRFNLIPILTTLHSGQLTKSRTKVFMYRTRA